MKDFTSLLEKIDAQLGVLLAEAGFRKVAPVRWNRCRGKDINVVEIQRHSSEKSFCVNLGIHYSFLPKAGVEVNLNPEHVELVDCEIKLRLTANSELKDQWWPESILSVGEIVALMKDRGLSTFDRYCVDGEISRLEGLDIEGVNAGILSSLTKVRACLLLARIHEDIGNLDKCKGTASIGIKLAGLAVGPKKALREILKRCE